MNIYSFETIFCNYKHLNCLHTVNNIHTLDQPLLFCETYLWEYHCLNMFLFSFVSLFYSLCFYSSHLSLFTPYATKSWLSVSQAVFWEKKKRMREGKFVFIVSDLFTGFPVDSYVKHCVSRTARWNTVLMFYNISRAVTIAFKENKSRRFVVRVGNKISFKKEGLPSSECFNCFVRHLGTFLVLS